MLEEEDIDEPLGSVQFAVYLALLSLLQLLMFCLIAPIRFWFWINRDTPLAGHGRAQNFFQMQRD